MSDKEITGEFPVTVAAVGSFPVNWEGQFQIRRAVGLYLIDLIVKDETGFIQPAATVGTSAPYFENNDQPDEWVKKTLEHFGKYYRQAMIDALGTLLAAACQMALIDMELSPLEKEAVLRDQLQFAEKAIRHRLGLRPGRSPWLATELELAVLQAMVSVPLAEAITYDAVAERLRETHGERAPHSGEALRKMLKEFRVQWKVLKARADRARKSPESKNGATEKTETDENGETEIFH